VAEEVLKEIVRAIERRRSAALSGDPPPSEDEFPF
jgi:hypothetical protein